MWLVKADPDDYGWDQLVRDGETLWDGVTNAQALNHLRAMRVGDRVLVYHTGSEKAVVGEAAVVHAATGPEGKPVVRLRAVRPWDCPVPLAEIRLLRSFGESPLLRQGRLSVVPITAQQHKELESCSRRRS
jgi:predicted RNA-binding protein with PUA-like domain